MILNKKAKIIATLGPSSRDIDAIRKLAWSGVDVFRLNFSHGTHEIYKKTAANIRFVENEIEKPLAIMMDLQGPKLRIGVFEEGRVSLQKGEKFIFDLDRDIGNSKRVCLPHPEIFNSLKEGTDMLVDDGKVRFKVIENDGKKIEAEVIDGGVIANKKGVNIPNVVLPIPAITEKDKDDLKILNEIDADWVAISFIQNAEDILYARRFITNTAGILAKIEKPAAYKNLDSIIEVSDAVMVARGDLGVEVPFESIPRMQLQIIERARFYGKPVIVATQMLESMILNKVPTRAEVADVACAIAEEADAVMLSAESANGEFPEDAVKTMEKIVIQTEKDGLSFVNKNKIKPNDMAGSICEAINCSEVKIVAAFTESGRTALNVSRSRPNAYVIALTPSVKIARKLALAWGIYSIIVDEIFSFSQIVQVVQKKLGKILEEGDAVAIIAGIPFRISGATNLLHICKIDKNIFFKEN
ncbi:MAG: pyruvate kinase [Holosporales bacterium]|jgi:pyruvate kinase|nr:pyruvate kinase [Holosporales bacterium]